MTVKFVFFLYRVKPAFQSTKLDMWYRLNSLVLKNTYKKTRRKFIQCLFTSCIWVVGVYVFVFSYCTFLYFSSILIIWRKLRYRQLSLPDTRWEDSLWNGGISPYIKGKMLRKLINFKIKDLQMMPDIFYTPETLKFMKTIMLPFHLFFQGNYNLLKYLGRKGN